MLATRPMLLLIELRPPQRDVGQLHPRVTTIVQTNCSSPVPLCNFRSRWVPFRSRCAAVTLILPQSLSYCLSHSHIASVTLTLPQSLSYCLSHSHNASATLSLPEQSDISPQRYPCMLINKTKPSVSYFKKVLCKHCAEKHHSASRETTILTSCRTWYDGHE